MPEKTKVFRYNFHKNKNDKDQLMMIWQVKNYFFFSKKISRYFKNIFFTKRQTFYICIRFKRKDNKKT